jgi:hypothetical protein
MIGRALELQSRFVQLPGPATLPRQLHAPEHAMKLCRRKFLHAATAAAALPMLSRAGWAQAGRCASSRAFRRVARTTSMPG